MSEQQPEVLDELPLSNGSVLRRGGRVRVPRKVAFDIPQETREALGLYLDDDYSHDSEVVVWPLHPPRPDVGSVARVGTSDPVEGGQ